MLDQLIEVCPLCDGMQGKSFYEDKYRPYIHCLDCDLIYVESKYHLSGLDEKEVYDQHENKPSDLGYRKFLSRVFDPMCERIQAGSKGLDFGSGPGPTLSLMFTELGHEMSIYDKFYADDRSVFQEEYDFISTTEVIEHIALPRPELQRLWSCLKPGGVLGIMTKFATGEADFSKWHYKNDPTHITFYSRESFNYLAQQLKAEIDFVGNDVVILQKGD